MTFAGTGAGAPPAPGSAAPPVASPAAPPVGPPVAPPAGPPAIHPATAPATPTAPAAPATASTGGSARLPVPASGDDLGTRHPTGRERRAAVARRVWPWLRILLALAVLAVLARKVGTAAFVDGVRMVGPPAVAAALAIGLLTTVCSAGRWVLVARRLGLPLRWPTALGDYYGSLFLNAVLPAGVLGDAHRAVRHGQRAGDLGRGVRAVVLERAAGQAVLVAAGVAVLLARPSAAASAGLDLAPWLLLAVGAAVAGLAGAYLLRRQARRPVAGSPARPRPRWRRALRTALADARTGLLARDTWPGVAGLSAVALAGHLALFLVAARTAGSTAPPGRLLPLMLLALLVMAVPVNIGGFGPREAFLAVAFGAAGLGAQAGLTTAVVYGVLAFAASLPGAAVLLARTRMPRRT
ncbi:hypothetical protein Sru01_17570 [Sphaerisporangium rufum]|uniref:Uncharacterized protein n=1 Tax=Sphaerisporangium rufum TaxID=1381558 RepID=A0A919R445_9ACTN|nr:lysylphosphatidylglycerol synthase transmembrane domain-containing protein [Sphaerisporangium rufum]GII76775.1 hypothetical protein Sru01_17570 [Sphaerisporangium rufum]